MHKVICPNCNNPAQATDTQYGIRHDCCGLHSWGGKPLTDQETLDARRGAHALFDNIWKGRHLSRTKAYKRLSHYLNKPMDDTHMAKMDKETALMVPAAVLKIWQEIANDKYGNK